MACTSGGGGWSKGAPGRPLGKGSAHFYCSMEVGAPPLRLRMMYARSQPKPMPSVVETCVCFLNADKYIHGYSTNLPPFLKNNLELWCTAMASQGSGLPQMFTSNLKPSNLNPCVLTVKRHRGQQSPNQQDLGHTMSDYKPSVAEEGTVVGTPVSGFRIRLSAQMTDRPTF